MTEVIEVQLVPVNEADKLALREAITYLEAFHRLLNPSKDNPWVGYETIQGLRRIQERIRGGYAQTFEIPMPTARVSGEELMTRIEVQA